LLNGTWNYIKCIVKFFPPVRVVPIKFNKKNKILSLFTKLVSLAFASMWMKIREDHSLWKIFWQKYFCYGIKNVGTQWDQKCGYPHTDMRVVVLRYSNSRQMAAPAYMPIAHFPRHCRYRTCNKVLAV